VVEEEAPVEPDYLKQIEECDKRVSEENNKVFESSIERDFDRRQ
jgi:hypothetical protein